MMKIGTVALAALAFATPTTVFAADNSFAQEQTVLDLKGLDLATADGQQRLAIRMDQAAGAVCGERLAGVHLSAEAKSQTCRTAVLANIQSQIDARLAMTAKPVRVALR